MTSFPHPPLRSRGIDYITIAVERKPCVIGGGSGPCEPFLDTINIQIESRNPW